MPTQLSSYSMQASDSDRPHPDRIAAFYKFKLASHDIGGMRYYAIQDWITGISPSSNARKLWSKMKQRYPQLSPRWRQLDYVASDGKTYPIDHADAESLYIIAQRMDANTGIRDAVLLYLASSGVVLDELIRNPGKAEEAFAQLDDDKEFRKCIDSGFTKAEANQWVATRRAQKEEWRKITTEWNQRGISDSADYARLSNGISVIATGKRATDLKAEMKIRGTPRDYQSAADNAAIQIASSTSRILHQHRDSQGVSELADDIKDVKPIVVAARVEIDKVFSTKRRRLPSGKKSDNN